MKELSFEKMEQIHGGGMSYCELLAYWVDGGDGYQGSRAVLISAYAHNCLKRL